MPPLSPANRRAYDIAYSALTTERADAWPWNDAAENARLLADVLAQVRVEFPTLPERRLRQAVRSGVSRALRRARHDIMRLRGL